jgi:hypothetical protein
MNPASTAHHQDLVAPAVSNLRTHWGIGGSLVGNYYWSTTIITRNDKSSALPRYILRA